MIIFYLAYVLSLTGRGTWTDVSLLAEMGWRGYTIMGNTSRASMIIENAPR